MFPFLRFADIELIKPRSRPTLNYGLQQGQAFASSLVRLVHATAANPSATRMGSYIMHDSMVH